jgi:HK97 family phage prohead protease
MDKVYKVFESEVKKVGERQYEFTASDSSIDRDNEIIDVNGWDLKNFKKNPVIMYAHDYSTLPIGKATRIGVKDNKLVNVVEFPPEGTYEFADTVQRLVDTGYLKTQSVGFVPKTWEDGNGKEGSANRTYTKQELLEISIVPVPSNPNALRNAVKEGVITQKQLEGITKVEKKAKTSQEEIIDEIDYLDLCIEESGLNDEGFKALARLIKHIPVEKEIEDVVQETTLPVKDIAVNNTPIVVDNTTNDVRLQLIIAQTIKNVIKEL